MSKFNLRGKMTVTVHQARNLSNKELVGKMDPFCVIKLSGSKDEKFKTKIAQDQHQNPVWEQSYIFNLEGKEELLHANVWNQATLGDDHIGRLDLTLDAFDLSGKPRWYQLKDKSNFSKQTGELSLSIVFEGSGLPAGSVGFTTHEARIHPPAAAAAAPVSPPVIAAQQAPAPSPVATVAPPVVQQQQQQFHSQQPNYNQPPQQQQQQPQYGSGYPGQAPPQQQQFQQQQPQYAPQQPAYQPPQQPMYQQPPQPVYQQAPMQPVYASAAPVYQQPAAVVYQSQPVQFQPAAVVYQTQPAVVYQQQPQQRPGGQLIGYWPNGQPRYA